MSDLNDTDTIIAVNNLIKQFKSFKALDNLNFKVSKGEIFGLIGPDGAGKTTTFHILGGISNASFGEVKILDLNPKDTKIKVSYITQQFSLYSDLTVSENIDYVASIKNISKDTYIQRKEKYLNLVKLNKFTSRLTSQLSGGMKQKLALCCAVISEPEILLLDEPTTGVDPISRRDFWDILASLSDSGITIVVATPYLDEAERCTKVAFINNGRIVNSGSPESLKATFNLGKLEIFASSKTISDLYDEYNQNSKISNIKAYGDKLEIIAEKNDIVNINGAVSKVADQTAIIPLNLDDAFNLNLKNLSQNVKTYPYPFSKSSLVKGGIAIKADKLSKNFGSFKSVDSVNLEIKYGEIFGLLGANGAGKTTTIKMLCGLLQPSAGFIQIGGSCGQDLSIKEKIGYMSQKFVMYSDLTVRENLQYYLGIYKTPKRIQKTKLDWVINVFNLSQELDTLTGKLPGGYKQKLSFAASILHEPEILFLDEPTSGVDPFMRQVLWDYIRQLAKNGTAILTTTHFIPEAENCHSLGFMVNGKLVATGSPNKIKQGQKLLELTVDKLTQATEALRQNYKPWQVSIFGNNIHIYLDDINDEAYKTILNSANINISSQRIVPYTLEDAFIKIIETSEED